MEILVHPSPVMVSEMTDIPPINSTGNLNAPVPSELKAPTHQAESQPSEMAPDRVEISETAQVLGSLAPNMSVRAEKVAAIREAIAAGTYLTDEKIAVTVDRLLEALHASAV